MLTGIALALIIIIAMLAAAGSLTSQAWIRVKRRQKAAATAANGGGAKRQRRKVATAAHPPQEAVVARYVSWDAVKDGRDTGTLVVDCTHATLRTISHHKGQRNPPGCSDCSTGLVLDALAATGSGARAAAPWLAQPRVSVNHFDADAVLSMWAFIHRDVALQHSALLRHTARIGDLREAGLGCSAEALAARQWDGVSSEATVLHALQLCCWINTVERTRFTPPYIDKDADAKHRFFLDNLAAALTPHGILDLQEEWQAEYEEVVAGWQLLEDRHHTAVQRHDHLGLVVVRPPRPLHYYCIFSFAIGADVVLTVLPGNCYEVESRYTQFVSIHSRPVHARLDMQPLASALNRVDVGRERDVQWVSNSVVDTGPLLRLDKGGEKLPKAQRYGHPTQRPHYASGLPPAVFEAVVCSFYTYGLRGTSAKVGGWSWEELQDLNGSIDWSKWEQEELSTILETC